MDLNATQVLLGLNFAVSAGVWLRLGGIIEGLKNLRDRVERLEKRVNA